MQRPVRLDAPREVVGLHVVAVRMAAQDRLDVRQSEAELLDRRPEERHGVLEVRVDEDVARGRRDQVRVQRPGADVVEVPDDRVRR